VLQNAGIQDSQMLQIQNAFPATVGVLAAENMAWDAAEQWLEAHE